MGRFINPFTDWGFKLIFGQEFSKDLLISFLNDLLEGEQRITNITFKDKEQLSVTKDMRGIIYDVFCETDKGEHIIVEMQNRYQEYFIDRAIFYASRAIVGQGIKGDWNYKVAPVYTICFMNFNIEGNTPQKFRTDVTLMDMENNSIFSNKIRLIYLMLPLFNKSEEDCVNNFERWIYILKNMSTFERMPFMARNAVFKKLAEIADVTALSKEDRDKYDESIKIMRDYIATYNGAKIEQCYEIAKNMLKEGLPSTLIAKVTGLAEEKIKKIDVKN